MKNCLHIIRQGKPSRCNGWIIRTRNCVNKAKMFANACSNKTSRTGYTVSGKEILCILLGANISSTVSAIFNDDI